jgi:hypothetical protein
MEKQYKYAAFTWGGFYNKSNVAIHGCEERGLVYLDTEAERNEYVQTLKGKLNLIGAADWILCIKTFEGFDIDILPCLHRVIELDGKQYYSRRQWDWLEELSALEYHLEWKWTPGFNDYPAGDVDYTKAKIIQEWITGSFIYKRSENYEFNGLQTEDDTR